MRVNDPERALGFVFWLFFYKRLAEPVEGDSHQDDANAVFERPAQLQSIEAKQQINPESSCTNE